VNPQRNKWCQNESNIVFRRYDGGQHGTKNAKTCNLTTYIEQHEPH